MYSHPHHGNRRGDAAGHTPTPRTYYELSQAPVRIPFPREWSWTSNPGFEPPSTLRQSYTPFIQPDTPPTSTAAVYRPQTQSQNASLRAIFGAPLWVLGQFRAGTPPATPPAAQHGDSTPATTSNLPQGVVDPTPPQRGLGAPGPRAVPTSAAPTPQYIELQARVWRDLTFADLQRTRRLIKQQAEQGPGPASSSPAVTAAVAASAAAAADPSDGAAVAADGAAAGPGASTPAGGPRRAVVLSPPMTGIFVTATLVPPSAAQVYEVRRVWVLDNDTCEKCCLVPNRPDPSVGAGRPAGGGVSDSGSTSSSSTTGNGNDLIERLRTVGADPWVTRGHSGHADARLVGRRRSGGGGGGSSGGAAGGTSVAGSLSAPAAGSRHSPSVPLSPSLLSAWPVLLSGSWLGSSARTLSPNAVTTAGRSAGQSIWPVAMFRTSPTQLPAPVRQHAPPAPGQDPAATTAAEASVTCSGPPWAVGSSVDVVVQLVHRRTGERVLLRDVELSVGVEVVFRRREVAGLLLALAVHWLDVVLLAPLRLAVLGAWAWVWGWGRALAAGTAALAVGAAIVHARM